MISMNKLLVPQDKANHFLYGALVALLGLQLDGVVLGLILVVFIATVRELMGETKPSVADWLWTCAGGAVVLAGAWPGYLGRLLGLP